jgi:L-2-hydroxyglutarate oxidase
MGNQVQESRRFDVAIIGAGILGTATAYFLSSMNGLKVAVFEAESSSGFHASSRNTGVIHRPFYLDPSKKGFIADAASESYDLWKVFASEYNLPWVQNGTLEVTNNDAGVRTIRSYERYARENGMDHTEFEILDSSEIRRTYPSVNALCGIHSITDTSVDFGRFTAKLKELSEANGVTYHFGSRVKNIIETKDGITIISETGGNLKTYFSRAAVNVGGAGSLRLARRMGLGKEFGLLLFRGDYWKVDPSFSPGFGFHLYTVPRYSRFPFLDPHFIIRWNGNMEIGPNASLVFSERAYTGMKPEISSLVESLRDSNLMPRISLFGNTEFMSMVRSEWKSSMERGAMATRLRKFLPSLKDRFLTGRATGGIRGSLVDKSGFVPELVTRKTERTIHVLNYNSPGATGAPYVGFRIASWLMNSGLVRDEYNRKVIHREWERALDNFRDYREMNV